MTISVDGLYFSYEKALILEDISFFAKKGQFIGIFGPNGGGKTTLIQLLPGLLRPNKGQIKILEKAPDQVSDRIGYVPQMRRFDKQFPLSTLEVVLHGCLSKHKGWGGFSNKEKQQALYSLERVGLQDLAHQPFGTLSGGQTQRTLIARALPTNPEILLLDEATVGVDPDSLAKLFELLLELKKSMTILLVTHDLKEIASEMDQLFCINRRLTPYTPSQVCEHFALGLYHPKLKEIKPDD